MDELKIVGNKNLCTCGVVIRDGKMLVGLRNYTPDKWKTISVWTAPGGRCDEGETLEENLRRETAEETGITDLEILSFLGKVPGAKDGDTLYVFNCTTNQDPKLMEPEKFSEWKWFSKHEMPDNYINPKVLALIKS